MLRSRKLEKARKLEFGKAKKFGLDMQILEVLRRRKFISAATPTINPVPVEEFLIYFKVQKTDLS